MGSSKHRDTFGSTAGRASLLHTRMWPKSLTQIDLTVSDQGSAGRRQQDFSIGEEANAKSVQEY